MQVKCKNCEIKITARRAVYSVGNSYKSRSKFCSSNCYMTYENQKAEKYFKKDEAVGIGQ